MKRIVSISFVLIYLLLSVGVAKSTHLCMGRVMDTAYFSFDSNACFDMPEMNNMVKHCCDDETELLKIEEDHQKSETSDINKSLFTIGPVLVPVEFTSLQTAGNLENDVFYYIDPPPLLFESLYELECRYTFYG